MSDEMVTRVGYDPLVRVLDRLDKMLTAAGSPPETPHEEAVGALIAERDRLREILRRIASMDQPDTCVDCSSLEPGDGASWCWFCTAREALGEVGS